MFQSLGINNPAYNALRRRLATVLALVILLGNVSFPIAIVTGLVDLDPSVASVESAESASE
jgi:succinate dehydrogenase / fumarate reductase cytochrome b subunit